MQETIDQLEKNMEELNENLQKAEDEGHEKVTSAEQKLEEINAKKVILKIFCGLVLEQKPNKQFSCF